MEEKGAIEQWTKEEKETAQRWALTVKAALDYIEEPGSGTQTEDVLRVARFLPKKENMSRSSAYSLSGSQLVQDEREEQEEKDAGYSTTKIIQDDLRPRKNRRGNGGYSMNASQVKQDDLSKKKQEGNRSFWGSVFEFGKDILADPNLADVKDLRSFNQFMENKADELSAQSEEYKRKTDEVVRQREQKVEEYKRKIERMNR